MACESSCSWSFSELVSAFLDLLVAFLLLCVSATIFLASKISWFSGIHLLCQFHNFRRKNSDLLKRILIVVPLQNIASVQASAANKCPLNNYSVDNFDEEGKSCCNLVLDRKNRNSSADNFNLPNSFMEGGFESDLEETRACKVLFEELEKERNAAAAAAEEAMAMILRLQEEKAFIEMDARQYRIIMGGKYACKSEEIEMLNEVLARKEMENLFLVKEIEDYKQILYNLKNSNTIDPMLELSRKNMVGLGIDLPVFEAAERVVEVASEDRIESVNDSESMLAEVDSSSGLDPPKINSGDQKGRSLLESLGPSTVIT